MGLLIYTYTGIFEAGGTFDILYTLSGIISGSIEMTGSKA